MSKITETAAIQVARCTSLVNAFVAGDASIQTAHAKKLALVASSLEGVSKVTEDAWKSEWAETVKASLKASGMADVSISVVTSRLKMVTLALTHGIAPTEGEAFNPFADRCGDLLRAKGLLPENKAGAPSKPKAKEAAIVPSEYVRDGFEDNAAGRKEAKVLMERLGGAERAMALMIVCDQSESLAGILHAILPDFEAEFRQFAADLMEAPKAAPTAKRVRRA